jgi:hypothetical protein
MLREGFEPRIPVFEQAKTVHVLDPAATVTCTNYTAPSGRMSVQVAGRKCSQAHLRLRDATNTSVIIAIIRAENRDKDRPNK